ncbi:MAG: hypothetical protein WBP64_13670 [Nitrososphaeraceae archaeon]
MTYANNKLYENHQSNCTKYKECKCRIQQLEQDLTQKEEECMFCYRQFEDTKEARSKGSAKTRKRQYSYLKRGKET